jgi:hypothetical protein
MKFIQSKEYENYMLLKNKLAVHIINRLKCCGGSVLEMQKHFTTGGQIESEKYLLSVVGEIEGTNLIDQFKSIKL